MLLSIVVLSYNRPEQIDRILENLVDVENSSFNLIIKDDVSPRRDEIEEVFRKYSSRVKFDIKFHHNQCNMGYDRNLIDSFSITDSEYVMLLSDDDYIDSNKIAELIDSISRENYNFYYTPYIENGVLNRNPDGIYKFENFAELIYNSILFSGMVFKVKAVRSLRLDLNFLSNCIYSQVYIASRLIYESGNYGVLPTALILGGDGDNFFGKNESAKNSALLSDRKRITADLTYQQFLIKVVKRISEDVDARIWGIFEKEYVKRLFGYGLRARAKGCNVFFDFVKYYLNGNVKFYLIPFIFFIFLFLIPANISSNIYGFCIKFLRKSG